MGVPQSILGALPCEAGSRNARHRNARQVARFVPAVAAAQSPRFEVAFSKDAHAAAITGRAYVAISRTSDARRTPIQQTGENGVPLFGVNISALGAGQPAMIDATTFGHPIQSVKDIPAGEYWVQPFVNIYTKFATP